MIEPTIIGICERVADLHEEEAALWRAMAEAMGIAFPKLDSAKRLLVLQLLKRVEATGRANRDC